MASFNFWDFKISSDDYFYEFANFFYKIKHRGLRKILHKNKTLKDLHKGERAFIILSGPSLKNQDIKKLKGEILFFVNRGYKHEDYEYLSPKYHVIIDGKLGTGEWSLDMVDIIFDKNPNVTLILNAKWYSLERFSHLRDNTNIYWVDTDLIFTRFFSGELNLTRSVPGKAVFGACFALAVYSGIRDIAFLGLDGNGLAHEILKSSSHFYGVNEDNNSKTTKDYIKDLYMMSNGLRSFYAISNYCTEKGISLANMTEGGLLDMFIRKNIKDV